MLTDKKSLILKRYKKKFFEKKRKISVLYTTFTKNEQNMHKKVIVSNKKKFKFVFLFSILFKTILLIFKFLNSPHVILFYLSSIFTKKFI